MSKIALQETNGVAVAAFLFCLVAGGVVSAAIHRPAPAVSYTHLESH